MPMVQMATLPMAARVKTRKNQPGAGAHQARVTRGDCHQTDLHYPALAPVVADPTHHHVGEDLHPQQGAGDPADALRADAMPVDGVNGVEGIAHQRHVRDHPGEHEPAEVAVTAHEHPQVGQAIHGHGGAIRGGRLIGRLAGPGQEQPGDHHHDTGQQEAVGEAFGPVMRCRMKPAMIAATLANRLAAEDSSAQEGAAPVAGEDLSDHRLPGVGGHPAPSPCQTSMAKMITSAAVLPSQGNASPTNASPRNGSRSWTVKARTMGFRTFWRLIEPAVKSCGSCQPTLWMGGDQADQHGRVGHGAHEERDDGDKKGETHGKAEECAVQQVGGQVMPDILR